MKRLSKLIALGALSFGLVQVGWAQTASKQTIEAKERAEKHASPARTPEKIEHPVLEQHGNTDLLTDKEARSHRHCTQGSRSDGATEGSTTPAAVDATTPRPGERNAGEVDPKTPVRP